MRTMIRRQKVIMMIFILSFLSTSCFAQKESKNENQDVKQSAKVTFVELGSVNCVPCKQMQPVMKAVEEKYGDQINVIFYDVWTQEHKPYAQKYGIKLIPTQVFLDENGKEFHRHEGFYPESEIDKILQSQGIKPKVEI